MLLIDIYRYLKRRADKRPVYLKNFVDQSHHHGTRTEDPTVSIIIPTRDKVELLRACVESVIEKTSYKNYEIVIVDNQSADPQTLQYFDDLTARGVRIMKYPQKFNYSAICNMAAANSTAEYLCFLNNDTEIVSSTWLNSLLDHAVSQSMGVVGARLLYPNGVIQHQGVILGKGGVASHVSSESDLNIDGKNVDCFEVEAVTFACAVVKSETFNSIKGLDERFAVGLNDVDFCLRLAQRKRVVCSRAVLIHQESASRHSVWSPKGFYRAFGEIAVFLGRYPLLQDRFFSR